MQLRCAHRACFTALMAVPITFATGLPVGDAAPQADAALAGAELQVVDPGVWHFKTRRKLTYDPSRIAVFDDTKIDEAGLRTQAAAAGMDAEALERLPVRGWWMLTVPSREENPDKTVALARQLAEAACDPFVTPVFTGERGGLIAPSPWLLVRFEAEVDEVRAHAILAEAQAGDNWEADFGGMTNVYRIRTSCADGWEVLALAESLVRRPEVRFAEPDMLTSGTSAYMPNDPGFSACWSLDNTGLGVEGFQVVPDVDIDAPEAWDVTTGDPGVIVLVLDNGVQQDHPDINQIPGFDATGEDGGGGPVNACDVHGTAVAGIISARMDNALGTVGVAPNVSVASARVTISAVPCDGSWVSMDSWMVSGLAFGGSVGARVTNNSTGFSSPSSAVQDKYSETYTAGMVHFAAAGNAAHSWLDYIPSLPGVNAVAALEPSGLKASFSNYGAGLDYSAPGVHIHTTDRTGPDGSAAGDYAFLYGTSAASPCAAGVAALVLSIDPTLGASAVEEVLNQTCVDLGEPGYDSLYGWGMLNAFNAVVMARYASPTLWSLRATAGPTPRTRHAMAYDSTRGTTVMFGGGDPLKGDTWEWDGAAWLYRSNSGPTARTSAKMAFDSARGVTVLFGGRDAAGADAESWEWDGTHWEERFPANSPSPRHHHAMVYDSARGVTVLFGGASTSTGSVRDNETWEWDGTTWIQRFPQTRPSARTMHAMVYDANRKVTVMFGGRTGITTSDQNGETWEWDGNDWTQSESSGPQARDSHAMAYDADRRRTVLFGGFANPPGPGQDVFSDTWGWDGNEWAQIVDAGPPPRQLHALAYDAQNGRIVVFGGQVSDADADERDDTWEFGAVSPVDFDADGFIDLGDYVVFASCIAGPNVTTPPAGCEPAHFVRADLDVDGDVDALDTGAFQSVFIARP